MFFFKILIFFGRDFYNIINFLQNFIKKNMNFTYEFTLKERQKVKMENFWNAKSWKKKFRGIKTKSWHIYRDQNHI